MHKMMCSDEVMYRGLHVGLGLRVFGVGSRMEQVWHHS